VRVIEVIGAPSGPTTLQAKGYVGAECQQASRALAQALGHVLAEHQAAAFYQGARVEQSLRQ
jgi:hypothetical protein